SSGIRATEPISGQCGMIRRNEATPRISARPPAGLAAPERSGPGAEAQGALYRLTQPREQNTRTDLDESQGEERLRDVRPTLVANPQAPVPVRPGPRPLHRPAALTQPGFVIDPLLRQDRLDADRPQPLPVRLAVVGQVPLQGVGLSPRLPHL